MPIVEVITTSIGRAVGRSLLRAWLKDDGIAFEAGADLFDSLSGRIPDFLLRRRLARQLDAIADEVAEQLEPFFSAEFPGGLAANEQAAAAIAVATTLERGLNTNALMETDLDSATLESALRRGDPQRAQLGLLSAAASTLYDVALQESCAYVVAVAAALPDFALASTREILQREGQLIALVREVLARLPERDPETAADSGASARWELQYRRLVARRLGYLSLFGLDLAPNSQRYALDIAYLTQRASLSYEDVDNDYEDPVDGGMMRIDDLLASRWRTLVRGEAGTGKTTLLQWLAVMSAETGYTDSLEQWNGSIPFFIQLRHLGGPLPSPEQFVAQIAPALIGSMPHGWVHHQLESGSALVLIDGVDELPVERRDAVREWLTDLCDTYPDARYVVTSRPPAVAETWLDDVEFDSCQLEPMDVPDTRTFIEQWHDAAGNEESSESRKAEILRLEQRLLQQIDDHRTLRELASTPLLCAMLCALHRDRRANLPRGRVDLYRTALEMLLERRDTERDLHARLDEQLTRQQKQLLLQDLAYWLVDNQQVDVDRSLAASRIVQMAAAMPAVQADGDELVQHLLERTGLLREPVPGRLDFLHRTFQEYLAALQAVDQENIGAMITRAHEDVWWGVIVLAAGAASSVQRARLVAGLVTRGDAEPSARHRLHLLAVSCLETAPSLPDEVLQAVSERLTTLVPPSTLSEANALASAGDLAAPLLSYEPGRTAIVDRACVRALGRIGTPDALESLTQYASDLRLTVQRELVRAWGQFDDAQGYAERILASSPLDNGTLAINDPTRLSALAALRHLHHLRIDVRGRRADLFPISDLSTLGELELVGVAGMHDLTPLGNQQQLSVLRLTQLRDLKSLSGLEAEKLRKVTIASCPVLGDLNGLVEFRDLERVELVDLPAEDLTVLQDLAALRCITVSCLPVRDLRSLSTLPALRKLVLRDLPDVCDLNELEGLPDLAHFVGERIPLDDIGWLRHSRLQELTLNSCSIERGPGGDGVLTYVTNIDLESLPMIDLDGWEHAPIVEHIRVSRCRQLRGLDGLPTTGSLVVLDLAGCDSLTCIGPVSGLPGLRILGLGGCPRIETLEPLRGSTIVEIDISFCNESLDLAPLRAMPALRAIRADGRHEMLGDLGLTDMLRDSA